MLLLLLLKSKLKMALLSMLVLWLLCWLLRLCPLEVGGRGEERPYHPLLTSLLAMPLCGGAL